MRHNSIFRTSHSLLLAFFIAGASEPSHRTQPSLPCTQARINVPPLPRGPKRRLPPTIRFTFLTTNQEAVPQPEAFLTFIGRDDAGRPCHLNPKGQFLPFAPQDNQIPKDGRLWCAYGIPLRETPHLDLDRGLRIDSGRIYLSVGAPVWLRVDETTGEFVQPDPANPADPNAPILYDWIEFALDASGFHGNTTCVDQFGLPISLSVSDRRDPGRFLGPVGLEESRTELFRAWQREVPEPFRSLATPDGHRILAPGHAPARAQGAFKHHFQTYLAKLWQRYRTHPLILTPDEGTFSGRVDKAGRLVCTRTGDDAHYLITAMPTSTEVFLCDGVLAQGTGLEKVLGAQFAALVNRHVEDPLTWRDATGYYRQAPSNLYARFWHRHGLDGKAYGFAYDDVNDQSSSLATAEPLEIRVAFRWD